MPEPNQIIFSYKEVVEALIRKQGLDSGIWGLYVKFGIGAANIEAQREGGVMRPAAIIPILEIGLQRFEKENNLSVDASELEYRPAKGKTRAKKTAKGTERV